MSQQKLVATCLKLTGEDTEFFNEILDYLAERYCVIRTSKILKGDHNNSLCYSQIFKNDKER